MKKIILLGLLLYTTTSYCQELQLPIDENTQKVTYENVKEVDNTSKAELYYRAISWVNKTYKSSKDVIQYSDKDVGKIILKPTYFSYVKSLFGSVLIGQWNYVLTIQVKDNKYKYTFTDFYEEATNKNCKSLGAIEFAYKNTSLLGCPIESQLDEMIEDLNSNMILLKMSIEKGMMTKSIDDF
jgi:hypothetical protein